MSKLRKKFVKTMLFLSVTSIILFASFQTTLEDELHKQSGYANFNTPIEFYHHTSYHYSGVVDQDQFHAFCEYTRLIPLPFGLVSYNYEFLLAEPENDFSLRLFVHKKAEIITIHNAITGKKRHYLVLNNVQELIAAFFGL